MTQKRDKLSCSKCGSHDVDATKCAMNGFDMNTAIYGYDKYSYACRSCGNSGQDWV